MIYFPYFRGRQYDLLALKNIAQQHVLQRTYPWVIKFLYNFSFEKYPNREKLLNNNIINEDQRIVVQRIEKKSFIELVKLGETNESFIID